MSYKNSSLNLTSSRHSPINKKKSPANNQQADPQIATPSPIKYLLQNNIKLNMGLQGQRTSQQLQIISNLLTDCTIFADLQINIADEATRKQLCNGIVLIYCESPHIMEIKDNQIYVFFEGQGFQYMQNNFGPDNSKKYHLYENNEYIMLRKVNTNEYFLSLQESNSKYHSTQKKYQLMVDENTLIGKYSEEIFHKLFHNKIVQRQKSIISVLKKIQIFNGLPNTFFQQFSKFVSEQKCVGGDKVLSRQNKSKFVYFIKSGNAEMHLFNQSNRPSVSSNQNYYVSNNRPYTLVKLNQFDSFGMETELAETQIEKEVVCINECLFFKIDKRLLAIIITSFELQFQQKNKVWSQVNINNQIKGQNYCTPQKQLLLKNVERIRTSQRKIRDIKLRYLSSSKSKKQIAPLNLPKQQSLKEPLTIHDQKGQTQRNQSPQQRRRMIKTTEGRYRSSIIKFINNFTGLEEQKYNAIRKQLDEQRQAFITDKVSQIQMVALDTIQQKQTQKLRWTNAFDYKEKIQNKRLTRSTSKMQRYESATKFIPKLQVRPSMVGGSSKVDSQMIGVFLDKKIKNEILKKAQKVLNINKNVKLTQTKHLKRLFATSTTRNINAISQLDRKSIAQDIVDKMSNLRQNPLLLQIEGQRRKVQRQLKLSLRKAKASQSPTPNKKYKKEDQFILIKNQQ